MNFKTFAILTAAGALLAAPATGQATHKGSAHGKGGTKTKKCKATNVGWSVGGDLVSFTADDPATPANEASVTLKVTSANSHARKSGDLADTDATTPGLQYKGGEYTVTAANDAFTVKLNGYEGTDTPSVGDKVKVNGKVAYTKAKCAPAGTSVADRYAAANVRKVTISDRDPDA